MAVGPLQDSDMFVVSSRSAEVQDHAAVAALVEHGHILQRHPKIVISVPKMNPPRKAVVGTRSVNNGAIARTHPVVAVLVSVGGEQPTVFQLIAWVHAGTFL